MDRWSREQSNGWYARQPWPVGFNYVPSYACNTTEWWQKETCDFKAMERELGWAPGIGFNTIRVFIQYIVWKDSPGEFEKRFDRFLGLASKHHLSVMPVLFDDCSFGAPRQFDPFLGKQREPIPGMLGPSWTPSPGRGLGTDPNEMPMLKRYVQSMLSRFGADSRILVWDLYNEPMNETAVGQPEFLKTVFSWARESTATQPLTIGMWNDNAAVNAILLAHSDVLSFHLYADFHAMADRIKSLKVYNRPVLCTEWMARAAGSRFDTDLPLFKKNAVACYQWGFVNGRMQCQFPWSNGPGGVIDPKNGWFHDVLHPDGTPYRQEEIDAIKHAIKPDKNTMQNPASEGTARKLAEPQG